MRTGLRCESRKERYGFEDPGLDAWEDNIRMVRKDETIYTGFIWLPIESNECWWAGL